MAGAFLAIVLTALAAAIVLLRPALPARVDSGRHDLGEAASTEAGTSVSVPTERASGIGSRPDGDLDAVADLAFERGQTITVGVSDAFGPINPLYGGGDADQDAIGLIFEPLLRLGAEGGRELVLAESVKTDTASRTLTVQLRNDHIWRDGRTVSASDVVFTYTCLTASSYDGPLAGRFDDIASVAAGPARDGHETVIFTFRPGVAVFDDSLLTVGILKGDFYSVPFDRVYEMGRRKQPPEGSGAYQWLETRGSRRCIGLREGYAGDIVRIEQVQVGDNDKYDLLQAGELDIVRQDWSERVQSRVSRLPAFAYFDAFRIDQYLLASPDPAANGLSADPAALAALLRTATGQVFGSSSAVTTGSSTTTAGSATAGSTTAGSTTAKSVAVASKPLTLVYFAGLDDTVSRQQTACAELIQGRLVQSGQPVQLQPLSWPELADRASLGTFQLLLLPTASDNRLPRRTVIRSSRSDRPANAAVAFQHPQILLVSARLSGLKVNPNGAPFAASPMTFTDQIASVRILEPDGGLLTD